MQTWWDPQRQAWYTQDTNGTIRPATSGEVLLAVGNGYTGAPAGAPSPGATSPTPSLNPNPDQPAPTTAPSTAATITPPAAAPPAPDPFQGWNSAAAGSRSYRYFTPDLQQYYEQHPDEAFRQYGSAEFGDRQTPLSDYAKGRYNDYWAQYIKASEGNDQLHWTDYLSNDLAGQIKNSFALQSPTQKGYTLQYNPGGRITW